MSKLLKGEKVVCLINTRAEDYLTVGKEYKLQFDQGKYYEDDDEDDYDYDDDSFEDGQLTILDDDNHENSFNKIRFISAAEYRSLKIDNIIQ